MTALLRTALTGLLLASVPAASALAYDPAASSSGNYLAGRSAAKARDNGHASDYLSNALKADAGGAAAMFTNGLFGVYATIDGMARKAKAA